MTTTRDRAAVSAGLRSGGVSSFLEGLAAQDFTRLGSVLTPRAKLRALLPAGPREWSGAEVIAAQFASWFGDTNAFELVESTAGEVGGRLHLQWRLRLRAARLGAGWFTVEQQAYADVGDEGRIARLDVLCTGYRREVGDG
jgi:hypothetical protein